MALTVGELTAFLSVDKTQWKRDLNSLSTDVKAPAAKAGTIGGDEAGKHFGSSMLSRAKSFLGPLAALGAGAAVLGFGKQAFAEAQEAQKVGALTESVIKATGGAAQVTAAHVGDLANAISVKIGVDDEAVQSGENMLLTFKNIRNEVGAGNDIFDQSTQALADMSAAMGTDMSTSAVQLGKALNDPIKGITALTRVGVTFSDEQKKQIQSLVDAGDVMGAQKIILGELTSEFGGAAEAMATPADQAKVAWKNFQEAIGTAVMPVLNGLFTFLAGVLPKAGPIVQKVVDLIGRGIAWVREKIASFTQSGGSMVSKWAPAFAAVKEAGQSFWKAVGGIFDKLRAFWDKWGPVLVKWLQVNIPKGAAALSKAFTKIGDAVEKVIGFVSTVVDYFHDHEGAADALKAALAGLLAGFLAFKVVNGIIRGIALAQGILNVVMAANPIGLVVIAVVALVAAFVYAWKNSEKFRDIVTGALNWVKKIAQDVADFFTVTIPKLWADVVQWTKDAWNGLIAWITGIPGMLVAAAGHLWQWVSDKAKLIKDAVVAATLNFFEWVGSLPAKAVEAGGAIWDWITTKAGEIKDDVVTAISNLWTWLRDDLPGILSTAGSKIFDWIVNVARTAAVNAWNAIVGALSGGGDGGPGGNPFTGEPGIPRHATGGIVRRAHLGIVGEAGPEAILPLDKYQRMLDRAWSAGASTGGSRGDDRLAQAIERLASAPTGGGDGRYAHLEMNYTGPQLDESLIADHLSQRLGTAVRFSAAH